MSRRDTIIIALLMNAALLAVLFMLAVNVDEDTEEGSQQIAMEKPQSSAMQSVESRPLTEVSVNDEVDVFLKELKTSDSQPSFIDDEEVVIANQNPVPQPEIIVPAVPNQTQTYVEIKVKSGDVLEKIAKNNGTTVEAIKQANHLTSTKLSIGQTLKIPTSGKVTTTITPAKPINKAPVTTTVTERSSEPQYYTVKSGDSPWKIAKETQTSVDELLRLNNLDEAKARNLKIGDKIRVR